jgi:hypothetical protein
VQSLQFVSSHVEDISEGYRANENEKYSLQSKTNVGVLVHFFLCYKFIYVKDFFSFDFLAKIRFLGKNFLDYDHLIDLVSSLFKQFVAHLGHATNRSTNRNPSEVCMKRVPKKIFYTCYRGKRKPIAGNQSSNKSSIIFTTTAKARVATFLSTSSSYVIPLTSTLIL